MAKRNLSKELAVRAAGFKKLNLKKLDGAEWENQSHRRVVANHVLQIHERVNALLPDDGPIQKAFDAFALNPANPRHWRTLLEVFADLHFGRQLKTAGRKPKWTTARKSKLAEHFVGTIEGMQRQGKTLPRSLEDIARIIKNENRPSYSDTTGRQIYLQLRAFFGRDKNTDPQFLTWIAERLEG
jgi:hypothetical protein